MPLPQSATEVVGVFVLSQRVSALSTAAVCKKSGTSLVTHTVRHAVRAQVLRETFCVVPTTDRTGHIAKESIGTTINTYYICVINIVWRRTIKFWLVALSKSRRHAISDPLDIYVLFRSVLFSSILIIVIFGAASPFRLTIATARSQQTYHCDSIAATVLV